MTKIVNGDATPELDDQIENYVKYDAMKSTKVRSSFPTKEGKEQNVSTNPQFAFFHGQ